MENQFLAGVSTFMSNYCNIIDNFYGIKKLLCGKKLSYKTNLITISSTHCNSVFASNRSYLTTTTNRERLYIDIQVSDAIYVAFFIVNIFLLYSGGAYEKISFVVDFLSDIYNAFICRAYGKLDCPSK